MGVSHIAVKKGVYSGGRVRFWKGRIFKGKGIFWEGGVDSGRAGWIIFERRI